MTLNTLEGLLAGVWLGAYLFTTFIVSPALKSLPVTEAERIRVRSTLGRRYGKLAGPLLLVWLVVLLLQGFSTWTLVRLTLLLVLTVTVGAHGYFIGSRMQALAEREVGEAAGKTTFAQNRAALQRFSSRITSISLVTSLLLAVLTLSYRL